MVKQLLAGALLAWTGLTTAQAQEFPFNQELTLQTQRLADSKRLPTLTIGPNGEAEAGLWCRTVRGQFSVAGSTLIFIPGASDNPTCSAERAERDARLLDALSQASGWTMEGEILVLTGPTPLRYTINTN